jgi:Rieske Fe-S protein
MPDVHDHREPAPGSASRRGVLLGAGAFGAAGLLAACGSDTPTTPTTGPPPATDPPTTTEPPADQTFSAAEVPVGSGKVFKDENIVITQPTAGQFRAFDATCQHQQCQVTGFLNQNINCACHGSQYNINDGRPERGPTTRGLIKKTVTVDGDTLTVT